jgi:hypothetical protein
MVVKRLLVRGPLEPTAPIGQVVQCTEWWGLTGPQPAWYLVRWPDGTFTKHRVGDLDFMQAAPLPTIRLDVPITVVCDLIDCVACAEDEGQGGGPEVMRLLVEALGLKWDPETTGQPW